MRVLHSVHPGLKTLVFSLAIVCSLIALAFFSSNEATAHPEFGLCGVNASIDPALCRQLAAADNGQASSVNPLYDDKGEILSSFDAVLLHLEIGIRHILPGGADHILFVLALFFASHGLRSLIVQVSAFTIAHTATLGLTAAGVIEPPASIVEPLIAISITFVAIENFFLRDISKWRLLVVFGFGLVHGMGFAGFIRSVGLPPEQFWPSLIGFNIGVELGQLAVIMIAFLISIPLKVALRVFALSYRTTIVAPASILISAIGIWWATERILGL